LIRNHIATINLIINHSHPRQDNYEDR